MYLLFKLLHVVFAIAFLGNIAGGLFWHMLAARTRDPRVLAFVMDGIIRSDRLFTNPGAIGIVLTGFAAAGIGRQPILGTPWILWSIVLFTISGLIFGFRLVPLQRKLRALAEEGARGGEFDYARYRALAFRWEVWGAFATLTPLAGLVLMVLKPGE